MKKLSSLTALLLLFILSNLSYGQGASHEPEYISNQIIVRMQKGENPGIIQKLVPDNFELKIEEVLSQYSDIWLLSFNENNTDVDAVLREVSKIDKVWLAQKNHVVQLRTSPNDPLYGNQWQHQNIDSELAWDITTGGTTPNGTDIVVAVIESADVINHPDLKDNRWTNQAEIPGNGIDDDGNGYVDDYNGWNVSTNNDNIGTGSHGTSCAGMIGAKGDNSLGVAGINWNVKIMVVAGHSSPFTESNIVSAYNYALQARLKWNNSNGTEGAFVVATSASWGIDYGNPNSYPIWCGFYEDLGEVGILNAGATTNSNLNVDNVGDVPSACPSDYMVSVTATNSSDVIDFAGYGQNTINVGAPGSSIYTTSSNGNYTYTSGTSFATPLTAGLIGLLYSVPCPNLEVMAMSDPQGTADIVRQALFDGVDQNSYLMTRTTTGGRINARNSIDLLMESVCSSCVTPSQVTTTSIQEYTTSISFESNPEAQNYTVYISVAGAGNWTSYTTTSNTFTFTNLTSCTDYEYYVKTDCGDEESSPSAIHTFTTSGCGNCIDLDYCETTTTNPSLALNVLRPNTIAGNYFYEAAAEFGGDVANGYKYGKLVLVDDGTSAPDEGCNSLINSSELNGNIALIMRGTCNFTVKVKNAQNAGAIAAIVVNNVTGAPIAMGGTDNTITIPAVMVSQSDGNAMVNAIATGAEPEVILGKQNEWIESFELNNVLNTSGDNNGYLLTSNGLELTQGQSYTFTVTPGFDGPDLPEYTRIWIDLNQDGTFGSNEIVYDSESAHFGALTDQLTVPSTALSGSTRMRVQMAFYGGDNPTLPSNCGSFVSGEIEDYCISISTGQFCNMDVTSTVEQPTCAEVQDGSISVTVENSNPNYTYSWNNGGSSNTITDLGSNNYTLTITDDTGCDTTMTFSLNYTRQLTIENEITHPSCQNSNDGEISVVVSGGNSYTYNWNNGATTPTNSGLGQGSYSLIVTDELGCKKSDSYTLTAPNVPSPTATFNYNSNGYSVTFANTSTNASNYFWDFGDGESSTEENPTHTYTEYDTYNVCLTSFGECDTVTSCESVIVKDGSSGVSIDELNSGIKIFPNPASQDVTILKENSDASKIVVYNAEGRLVEKLDFDFGIITIKVSNWETGIYLFHFVDKNNEFNTIQKVSVIR